MESLKDLLLVEEISKSFGGQKVLDNLSFAVRAGEFLSVLGPSGCGKTTLLRILIGLLPADSGRLLLRGQEITQQPPDKRSMGIVFQNYALFENMTVLRNVEYAMRLRPELRAGARQRALQLLEQVGLAEHVKKYPAQLSGGQMQRVAIARCFTSPTTRRRHLPSPTELWLCRRGKFINWARRSSYWTSRRTTMCAALC